MTEHNQYKKINDFLIFLFFLIFFLAFDIGIFYHNLILGECIAIGGFFGSIAVDKYLKKGMLKSKNFPLMFIVEISLMFIVQIVYMKVVYISLIKFVIIYSLIYSALIIIIYVVVLRLKSIIFDSSDFLYNFNDKINFAYNYLLDRYNVITRIYILKNSKITATAILNKNQLYVYIQNYIYDKLNDVELSLLILHEFAHIKYKHLQKRIIFYAIPVFLFTLLSSVLILGYTYSYQFYYTTISFIYLSISLLMSNKINLHNEIEADKFAMGILNDGNNMESLIIKAYDFVFTRIDSDTNRLRTINFKNKRIRKIKGAQ